MSPEALVEQLAEQHDAHLRWLRSRIHDRLAADEVEDVLQGAYARALTNLSAPRVGKPQFERPEQATAWLRTIALNIARDLVRERRGRSGAGRLPRPAPVGLDDFACAGLVADVDVEGEVLGAAQRESHRRAVFEAISRLDARHRQILQLRYGRDLPPATIMVLVGLDRRQWDGRHTRALKAFRRELARVTVTRECRQTRSLLKVSPAALLRDAGGAAGDHITSCLACAAFANAARFALSSLPLPLAIEAWRLDAVEVLARPTTDRLPAGGRGAVEPQSWVEAAAASPSPVVALSTAGGALATVAAVVLAGSAMGGWSQAGPEPPRAEASRAARATPAAGTRLAVHLTPRQTLERAARESGRRRARSVRRAEPRGRSSPWRPPGTDPR